MKCFSRQSIILLIAAPAVCLAMWLVHRTLTVSPRTTALPTGSEDLAGSATCRECHEEFYELWAPSHHGLAMQQYTERFAETHLTACEQYIEIGAYSYRVLTEEDEGCVLEKGPEAEKRFPIAHVLGGKNIYYFLTPMEKGRLQTLPLAYDIRTQQWFDTAASAVRHFPSAEIDEALHWTDSMYTFNTSCYGCHVSQLRRNYDIETDTYETTWAEPGINCETCHGPAREHVETYRKSGGRDPSPERLGLISTKAFSPEQMNSLCNSCHAKTSPITASFRPGDRYFDHFDLVTLEHSDFHPDGRDLGENYTMTTWRMSPCLKSGRLDCMHCHTSSGRYRFRDAENPNAACLPCHMERVENVSAHTHHEPGSAGSSCVACHMPMTGFARMRRSDHSMRPPTPAATLQFQSPNACNICHDDRDAGWADEHVRRWHERDYQRPVLESASLLHSARRGKWDNLNEILACIRSSDRDEIYAVSLLRTLSNCESELKWPTIIEALVKDPSPLVRAAAARNLDGHVAEDTLAALLQATKDEYRLVRIRAAEALASISPAHLEDKYRSRLTSATEELVESFLARPDDYASHYNKGNFHMDRMEYEEALKSYRMAIKLRSDFVPPYVNIAFVYNATGENEQAEKAFRKAADLAPENAAIHLNLGMLLGEMQRPTEAEKSFRKALKADPNSAAGAYNLGVLLAESKPRESLAWCLKAFQLQPNEGKYGYTYAFFLNQRRQTDAAVTVLKGMIDRGMPCVDAYVLLGTIYLERGESDKAVDVYRMAQTNEEFDPSVRHGFRTLMEKVK